MTSYKLAIDHLCDKKNKVSSHYLISRSGKIYNLVDSKFRAWHAGQSFWRGNKDINSSSIGIEMDNSGHHLKFENYKNTQIDSLIYLLKFLKKKFRIKSSNILGHSDIAPYRKIDPGEKFPWIRLSNLKIAKLPKNTSKKFHFIVEFIFRDQGFFDIDKKTIYLLSKIGFDTSLAKKNRRNFSTLIKSYQIHYRPSLVSGKIDFETYNIMINHFKESLTI